MTSRDERHTRDLAQQLAEAKATIAALLSGQIDAVVDARNGTPVLLANALKRRCGRARRAFGNRPLSWTLPMMRST